jgi:hypothetical protein
LFAILADGTQAIRIPRRHLYVIVSNNPHIFWNSHIVMPSTIQGAESNNVIAAEYGVWLFFHV